MLNPPVAITGWKASTLGIEYETPAYIQVSILSWLIPLVKDGGKCGRAGYVILTTKNTN